VFNELDMNGDGEVQQHEFLRVLEATFGSRAQRMFAHMDRSADSALSFAEVVEYCFPRVDAKVIIIILLMVIMVNTMMTMTHHRHHHDDHDHHRRGHRHPHGHHDRDDDDFAVTARDV
jgi:hypothetical protein